jgi:dTDP-4-dehydrorhamnose 3,5-epimerase
MNISWSDQIQGLALIDCDRHSDPRGSYQLLFDSQVWTRSVGEIDAFNTFLPYQTSYSKSTYGVLRGLHGDLKTSKLISCPHGSFQLVIVDIHPRSKTFGNVEMFRLNESQSRSVLIPRTCANGHLVTSSESIFHYLQDTSYGFHDQFTLSYRDEAIASLWDFQPEKVSTRDHHGLTFAQLVDSLHHLTSL